MTKDDALNLISSYCEITKNRGFEDEIVTGLRGRFPPEGSEAKAMRWLGFMQGALYTHKVFTLDELKKHSMERSVSDD